MIETTKMSTRGQIIIPKGIREYINAGDKTIFTVTPIDKETIIMKKMDEKQLISDFKKIRASITKKLSEEEITNEIKASRKT